MGHAKIKCKIILQYGYQPAPPQVTKNVVDKKRNHQSDLKLDLPWGMQSSKVKIFFNVTDFL